MKQIYLASPFFNDTERGCVEEVARMIRAQGHSVYVPMEHTIEDAWEMNNSNWGKAVFNMDRMALNNADVVVALDGGLYGDTGTAWECGYAYAMLIPVVLIDFAQGAEHSLMMVNGATTHVNFADLHLYDFDQMRVYPFKGEQK